MKRIAAIIVNLLYLASYAQSDSLKPSFAIHGYMDIYYSYDFGSPPNHQRPDFLYSYNRHNEFNLNLGFISVKYMNRFARANLALAAGTYMSANYAAEPDVLKNIFEASAGIKISKKSSLWIDAGIFASHLGFESAIGKDCWTMTRSIMAENSPYFETGAKISYTSPNEKWLVSGLLLNGWQRIQRVEGNSTPAFGHQVTFTPNEKFSLNSSSFIGNDKPDSIRKMRYFHDLYARIQWNQAFGMIVGFDIGAEQKTKGSSSYHTWYTPVVIARYSFHQSAIALRGEYYHDPANVIISTGYPYGFSTWGFSANYDLSIRENILWRIEARTFSANDKIFLKDALPASTNFALSTSLAVAF